MRAAVCGGTWPAAAVRCVMGGLSVAVALMLESGMFDTVDECIEALAEGRVRINYEAGTVTREES